ncbi:MAG: DUF6056 family protein [bacterium]
MNKKINNIFYICTVIISVFVIVSIISIGVFTWPKADDFSLLNQINKIGVIQHVIKVYNDWDGRAMSLGIIQNTFLKYLPVEIISTIWASCLVLTGFLSLKTFLYLSGITLNKKSDYVIGTAIFSSVLWYGFKPHLSDTVYWATGGVYSLALLLGAIWFYLWLRKFSCKLNIRTPNGILFCLFTVYVGALTENLSCAVLAYMGVELILFFLKKDRAMVKKTILMIVLLMIGLLFIVVAPGNFIRSTYGPKSFIMDFSVFFFNFKETLVYFLKMSKMLILSTTLSIPLILIFLHYAGGYEIHTKLLIRFLERSLLNSARLRPKNVLIEILQLAQFVLAALASIFPFIVVPDFVAPRASIYFMAFIFFSIYFGIIPKVLKNTMSLAKNTHTHNPILYYLPISYFLLFIFFISISHIINLNRIKKDIIKREQIIKTYSNKNIDVITYPIDKTKLPFSFTFSDITPDKNHWINQAVATTYKLKSIRTDSNLIPSPYLKL